LPHVVSEFLKQKTDLRLLNSLFPRTENKMRLLALSFCALALLTGSSSAQQSTSTAAKGPTLQSAAIGFHVSDVRVDATARTNAAPLIPRHQGQDVALMAVGVGAMIAGALIGDTAGTIIIIGGAAMALFGLYHYLE
jgi:hypothetical protein